MKNKTWGGRFNKTLDPRVAEFNASLAFDHVLFEKDILGSQAHAMMLGRQGIIPINESQAIHLALDQIKQEIIDGVHPFDETYEDIHMFIEHLLIQKLGDVGKKLHTGRSRNDQVAVDLRMYTRDASLTITERLYDLIVSLETLAEQHKENWMPGYTHLQQAQPIRLGTFFGAYHAMFERDKSRLHDWLLRMNYSPLGAGALAGSNLPLDRTWVAEKLGFNGVVENTLDAVSDRDFVIELCSVLSIIMMHCSRMAEDLILWSTQEFGFITLDDAFATGSSLMPNKKNPDVLELIRGKSGRVFGHLMAVLTMMKGLPLAYNKDMQEDKEALFDTITTVTACINIMTPFLKSLRFNTTLMHEKAHSGYLDATTLLESLVMKGVPFRDAHHQVGEWVATAMVQQCSLSSFMKEKKHSDEVLDAENANPQGIHTRETNTIASIKTRHCLTGTELSVDEIQSILNTAQAMKKKPDDYRQAMVGKSLAMIFEKPSFRTRLSFAMAIQSMGGIAIESVSNTRKQEEPADQVRVLNGYADIIMVRTHGDQILRDMTTYATIPIINGLSALHHPCQVLADLLSLQETFGELNGLTLAYIGDGNNILHSLMLLAPQLGMSIHYCCPPGHQPNPQIRDKASINHDNLIHCFETPEAAVHQTHAVYTDVWSSMGFEAKADNKAFNGFQINEALMSQAKPEAVFMHCMPMERGKEVSLTLPDSPASIIFTQSENRMHVQKALMLLLRRDVK